MKIALIVLAVIVAIVAVCVGLYVVSRRKMDAAADKFTTVGTVAYWAPSKLPMFGAACISYTKKGKPMQAMTGLIPNKKQPKIGAKGMWVIYTYRVKGKAPVVQAKPQKMSAKQ